MGKIEGKRRTCQSVHTRRVTGLERQLIKLRRDVIGAREKWERVVIERQSWVYELRAGRIELPSPRAPTRRIYFVEVQNLTDKLGWVLEMQREIARLDKRIASLVSTRERGGRGLWLPKLMFDPLRIDLTTYYYRNATGISQSGAEVFLREVAPGKKMPVGEYEYFLVRPARKEHRMRLLDKPERKLGSVPSFKMPEWSVCFVTGGASLPSVRREMVKPNRGRQPPATLTRFKRTATYIAHKEQLFLVALPCAGEQKNVPVDVDDW